MDTPGHLDQLRLRDGRTVDYWDGGNPSGPVVLLQPGTPSCRLFGLHFHDDAVTAGVRLVSVSRPGYGGSTTTAPGLASTARDGVELADALGIATFASLGVSGGGPFAVATACVSPGRVRAVGVVAGVGQWPVIEAPSEDDAAERAYIEAAGGGDVAAGLDGLRADAERSMRPLLDLDDAAMVEALFSNVPGGASRRRDDPVFREVWARDLREGLGSFDGLARDGLSWGCPWDVDLAEVRAPALLWYGESDRMVPVAHGEWLARQIEGARLTVLPGAGHGETSFDHAVEVLRALA